MTQKINDKLKKCCELCQSHLDKPCAWLSLGNEYCDTIMEVQSDIEIKDKVIDYAMEEIHSIVNLGEFIDRNIDNLDTKEEIKEYFYKEVEKVGGEDE